MITKIKLALKSLQLKCFLQELKRDLKGLPCDRVLLFTTLEVGRWRPLWVEVSGEDDKSTLDSGRRLTDDKSSNPPNISKGIVSFMVFLPVTDNLYCEFQDCRIELLHPPEDCNVNSSLPFTLQICRVEDINIEGIVTGCVVHFHWVRTVVVHSSGKITTSALGCTGGVGRRTVLKNGLAGGGGHGGKGGEAYYDGSFIEGGVSYGEADLPCELGSGSGNANLAGATAGGGIIVMGSLELSLSSLTVYGSLRADGESFGEVFRKRNRGSISNIGPGGGSGGGGGGWVHFHWSDIPTGDVYQPIASVRGSINTRHQGSSKLLTIKGPLSFYVVTKGPLPRGGFGRGQSHTGENGTITGKVCPKGFYGLVILLALVLSIARMKYVGGDELPPLMPAQRGSQIDHSFPFLESLNEVPRPLVSSIYT
ncbi:hypothetical protein V6N13_062112 [Hibiscus sabdariffa]